VVSCQKSSGGLAQSALVLHQGEKVDPGAMERALLWLQSSSPSALLLASAAASVRHATSARGQDQRRRALAIAGRSSGPETGSSLGAIGVHRRQTQPGLSNNKSQRPSPARFITHRASDPMRWGPSGPPMAGHFPTTRIPLPDRRRLSARHGPDPRPLLGLTTLHRTASPAGPPRP
jgi:hypothetical protein